MKIWSCKIGEVEDDALPHEIPLEVPGSLSAPRMLTADQWMRLAVERAYEGLTGEKCTFDFSGWGAELDESKRAAVEGREPDYFKTGWLERRCHDVREHFRIDNGLDEGLPQWTPEQWIAAINIKLGEAAYRLHAQLFRDRREEGVDPEDLKVGVENLLAVAAIALDAVEALEASDRAKTADEPDPA